MKRAEQCSVAATCIHVDNTVNRLIHTIQTYGVSQKTGYTELLLTYYCQPLFYSASSNFS